MSDTNLSLAADAFWSRRGARKGLQFRRFGSLAEAVRFMMEDKSEVRSACTVETDEAHFSFEDIERLYARMAR